MRGESQVALQVCRPLIKVRKDYPIVTQVPRRMRAHVIMDMGNVCTASGRAGEETYNEELPSRPSM